MEQLDYNLLFRWFVGFKIDGPVWGDPTVFTKNRDWLLEGEVAQAFFEQVLTAGCPMRVTIPQCLRPASIQAVRTPGKCLIL